LATQNQISSVTIPCLCLSENNVLFLDRIHGETVIGKVLEVPCRNIIYNNYDFWAIPIKDSGIFTTLEFLPIRGEDTAAPTFDSFVSVRISDKLSNNEWMVYGTKQQFLAASDFPVGSPSPTPMPGISPSFSLRIAPCQVMNIVDGSGNPYAIMGIPTLDAGYVYFPYGSRNNVAYPSASTSGYANTTTLLAYLNATFTPYVWTIVNNILFATGGTLNDSLCVNVIEILPSP
jgi:hypothetical protein